MAYRALVVGIARYANLTPLPKVVLDDAIAVERALGDPASGLFAPGDVRRLAETDATRVGLVAALDDLARASTPDTTAVVYLPCHGGTIASGPRAGRYMLPIDADASSPDALADSAISGDELTAWLRRLPAGRALMILDCCHAGGIGAPKAIAPAPGLAGFSPGFTAADHGALVSGPDRAILAAARSEELAWVLHHDDHSLFTKHLLAGLRGAAAGRAGEITVFDLYDYIQRRIRDEGAHQHPVFKGELTTNFAIARTAAPTAPTAASPATTAAPTATTAAPAAGYDAYFSFAPDDEAWVYDVVVPYLEARKLRIVTSDSDTAGVGAFRVASVAQGVARSRRTVAVLSPAYLAGSHSRFEALFAIQSGVDSARFRLVPFVRGRRDELALPGLLTGLVMIEYGHPRHGGERALARLAEALSGDGPALDLA
jgi:hypothetical protein